MSLRSMPPEQALDLILCEKDVVLHTVAAGAFTFWEYCLTFNQEVDLVWRRRQTWGVTNFLFVFIRYTPICARVVQLLFYTNITGLIHPDMVVCRNWMKFEVIIGHTMMLAIDILLAMRTYAFYDQDRKVLVLVASIILAGQVASIVILVLTIPKFIIILSDEHTLNTGACITVHADPAFPNYLVPTAIVETCLTLLVILKFMYNKVTMKTLDSRMLWIFIRDGAWAFVLVLAGLSWAVVTYKTAPVKGDIAITWLVPILSFCGTRLVLNLRSEVAGKRVFSDPDTPTLPFHVHGPWSACPCKAHWIP